MKPFIYISLFFFLPLFSAAQEEAPVSAPVQGDVPAAKKQFYFLSPRISVTVPHPMANKSFKKSFVGIYEVSGGLNLMLYKGLYIGASGKNGLLKITENKIADYNASMDINNVSGKIGTDLYVGEKNRIIFSASVSYGKNWTRYSGLKHKDPSHPPKITSFGTNYIEPEMNLFFLIESNFGIGATLSYTIFDTHFDPYDLALNEYTQFDSNNAVATQFVSFGFGFYYSLIKKK